MLSQSLNRKPLSAILREVAAREEPTVSIAELMEQVEKLRADLQGYGIEH